MRNQDNQEGPSRQAALRKIKKVQRQAQRTAEQKERELLQKKRALSRTRHELEEAKQNYETAAKERDSLKEQLRERNAALRALEQAGERSARVNADLRRDLRQFQDLQRNLDVVRSDFARQVAAERRRIGDLKLQLASVPRGTEAMWRYLRAEEDRIRAERDISVGGAKERADEEWTNFRRIKKAFLQAHPEYVQPRPVKIRPKSSLRLVALGGSDEVGKSCYLLELGDSRILVDCGIKPSDAEDLHPDIGRLDALDALILTHAHTDHIGWVPALVRRFPELDIYCSEGTAALLPVMLADCRDHYIRKIARQRDRARFISNAEVAQEQYEEEDVHAVPNLAITSAFGEEETLSFGDVSLRLFEAGHILGAASVLVETRVGGGCFSLVTFPLGSSHKCVHDSAPSRSATPCKEAADVFVPANQR